MSNHSEIWEFGPGKEFADFNSAITALNTHFAGGSFTSDQFLLGTPDVGPYRDIDQLNDKVYPFVFNGYKLVISSSDPKNRIKFSGKRVVPGNTFLKNIEDQEPSGPVWKTDWLQTQPVTSYNELYEDSILLIEKTSISEVENTPGSYFVDVDRMMYVHARDSSPVRISGQYEFTINKNIFKWVCFDLNDQPKNINILDVDFDHSLESCIRLERNLFNLTSFDGFTVLNCRFRTNHRFIEANGAINGMSIRGSSFIEDSNFAAVDSGIILDSVGSVTITHNYLKTYDDSWIISINSISGVTNVNENIIINGEVGLQGGDESNFKRNIFRRSNDAGNNGMALKATSPINNIIGNAFIGFNNNTWYVDTAYNTGIYNFQNNTVWTELGARQVLFVNVRDDATINSRLNLISIKGIIYDGPSLGSKSGNVYLMPSAPVESKSRSDSYRNVFSRTYSYSASIDAIDLIPKDDICKSVLRRGLTDPEDLDITGALTPCHITAGCIQTNYGETRLESFRWLPDWITEVSLPDELIFQNYNAYASKNRRYNTGCEGSILPTDPPTLELVQQIFAPVFHVTGADVTITIVPTPPACEIRYTEDGSTPSLSSLAYSGETLHIYSDTTLKARGFILNEAPGPVSSVDVLAPAADPYFEITQDINGNYILSLYSNDSWASEIHYTSNGVDPTLSDPVWDMYTPSVVLTESVTYKARAFATGRVPSNVVSQSYAITADPVFIPSTGKTGTVELTCSTPDSTIYYKEIPEAPVIPPMYELVSLVSQFGPGKYNITGYSYPSWQYIVSNIECIAIATYSNQYQEYILYWDLNGIQQVLTTSNGYHTGYTAITKTDGLVSETDTPYTTQISISASIRIYAKAFSLNAYPSSEVNSNFEPISIYNSFLVATNYGLYAYNGNIFSRVPEISEKPCVIGRDEGTGYLYVSMKGKIYKSTDHGMSWISYIPTMYGGYPDLTSAFKIFRNGTGKFFAVRIQTPESMDLSYYQSNNSTWYSSDDAIEWTNVEGCGQAGQIWDASKTHLLSWWYDSTWSLDVSTSIQTFFHPNTGSGPISVGLAAGDNNYWITWVGYNTLPHFYKNPSFVQDGWQWINPLVTNPAPNRRTFEEIRLYDHVNGRTYLSLSGETQNGVNYFTSGPNQLSFTEDDINWTICSLPDSVRNTVFPGDLCPVWDEAHSKYLAFHTTTPIVIQSIDGITWTDTGQMVSGTWIPSNKRRGLFPGVRPVFNRMLIGTDGGVYEYDGSTFSKMSEIATSPSIISKDPYTGIIYVGNGTKIYKSLDGGQTWSSIERTVPNNQFEAGVVKVFGKFGNYYYGMSFSPPVTTGTWNGCTFTLGYSTDLINWVQVLSSSYPGESILVDDKIYVACYGVVYVFDTANNNTSVVTVGGLNGLSGFCGLTMCKGANDFWLSTPGTNMGGNNAWRSANGFNTNWVVENVGFTLPAMMDYLISNPGNGKVFCASSGENPNMYIRPETTRLSNISSNAAYGTPWTLCTLPSSIQTMSASGIIPYWDEAHSKYIGLITYSSIMIESVDGNTWTESPASLPSYHRLWYGAVLGTR